jgi:PAS domain S-box-containing protein
MFIGKEPRGLVELVSREPGAQTAWARTDEVTGPHSGVEHRGASRTLDVAQRACGEQRLHSGGDGLRNAVRLLEGFKAKPIFEMYRDLFDSAPVAYLTLGPGGVIRAVNVAGTCLLGVDRARLIGRPFGLFLAGASRHGFSQLLGSVFHRRTKETCEVPLLKGGGRPSFVQVEISAAPSGKDCYAVVIDISARRKSQAELEAAGRELAARAANLEYAIADLEAFNSTVSHELCNPLTIIGGFAQVLRMTGQDFRDERSTKYLQGIHEGTQRMKGLIESLFDFSRVKRVDLHREQLDLSATACAVAAQLKETQPDSRVNFRIAQGVTARGDANLCRIVLDNLIGNAWVHSDRQGDRMIEFGMTELSGKPVYFVSDNGPGFDMADSGKLFVPFQRLVGVGAAGHGIGLATVKRIVKRHGGRVWAESCPGEGATFFFTLE